MPLPTPASRRRWVGTLLPTPAHPAGMTDPGRSVFRAEGAQVTEQLGLEPPSSPGHAGRRAASVSVGLLVLDGHLQTVFLKARRKRAKKRALGRVAIRPTPAPRRTHSTRTRPGSFRVFYFHKGDDLGLPRHPRLLTPL